MSERYHRNRIYISSEEQERIKNYRILFGGAGIGSNIAECALRMGFEHITIVDGDRVEVSNLNRQNYTVDDIGSFKAEALTKRLQSICPEAVIDYHTCFIDRSNVKQLIAGHDAAINALDFTSDIPFVFDRDCRELHIPVLHPYNFGWAGFVAVVTSDSQSLNVLSDSYEGFELKVARHAIDAFDANSENKQWLASVIDRYGKEQNTLPPPQLAIGSWIVSGLCATALFHLATGREVRLFPEFYFSSLLTDGIT